METETVAQPDAQTAPTDTQTGNTDTQTQTGNNDPFAVDESQFVSLTPEQRAALDPVLNKWKESAKSYTEKQTLAERKKYEAHVKKAEALDRLVGDQRFIKWYNETNNPQNGTQVALKSVASAEEWAQAYQSLSAGDPGPLEALQTKLVMSVGGPRLQQTEQRLAQLQSENQMMGLFSAHPDAKDLDQIGREDDPEAPSLLQLAAQAVMDKQGGTWEQAYELASRVAKAMENRGKRAALGMVTEKKGSATEKPSSNSKDTGSVVFVDTIEEAMTRNIEAAMDKTGIKYQVKK